MCRMRKHHGRESMTWQQDCNQASCDYVTEERIYNTGGFSNHMAYDQFPRVRYNAKAVMDRLNGVSRLRKDNEPVQE